MPDISTLLILLTLTNKNGFNSIKKAIETADNFSGKIQSISTIMNVLPNLSNLFNSTNGNGLASLIGNFAGSNGLQNVFASTFSQENIFANASESTENSCVNQTMHPTEAYVDTISEKLSRLKSN